jgi:hypothetical protein
MHIVSYTVFVRPSQTGMALRAMSARGLATESFRIA